MVKMNKKKENNRFGSDRIFLIICYAFLGAILLITLYPLYFVVIASVSDPAKVSTGMVTFLPIGINLDGYQAVLKDSRIVRSFLNSVVYTASGTIVNLVLTVPAAYALSRADLKGRKFLLLYFMIPMFLSGGMIPTYFVVRGCHLLDTMWSLILPVGVSVYNLIIARSFFQSTLSKELLDAARIDGCSNTRFFVRIALPLSKAIIAILVLYYGVAHWNSYFTAMIYLNDQKKFPFQLILRDLLSQNQQITEIMQDQSELLHKQQLAELMKYSLIIISSLPVMILYPFIQKYFVKGVMIGSLKE
ncbi:carbohydrate ABC transporter permease [Eisenbergiella tayi]|uniref:carbohydrate ABC transporter permease n=1 Tax=Eisenbergiella tayi TaxID=1432052 RepID=UPI000B05FCD2|nr:carbohydrate ABC transporter permease [Eisenbergiella tayi]